MRMALAVLVWALLTFALIDPAPAGTYQTLYTFLGLDDGHGPNGRLVMDAAGKLYGVTSNGGSHRVGNIYSFDPATGILTNLYSFTGGADGTEPQGGVTLDSGGSNLYGVTSAGGSTTNCSQGCGTIFRLALASSKLVTLHRFGGSAEGATPFGALTFQGGVLYGTTAFGGLGSGCPTGGCGTIFKYVLAAKTFETLHTLVPNDGEAPQAKLVRAPSGLFYGSGGSAGPNGGGTVFSINPASSAFAVVHGFAFHIDGAGPYADLVIHNGLIYGTMFTGGPTAAADGTVYQLDPATGIVTTLYSFTGAADGLQPSYGVTYGPSGRFYGTTRDGGTGSGGTLFKIYATTKVFRTIHAFTTSTGAFPAGPLLIAGSAIYGVTGSGNGTIYKYTP